MPPSVLLFITSFPFRYPALAAAKPGSSISFARARRSASCAIFIGDTSIALLILLLGYAAAQHREDPVQLVDLDPRESAADPR